MRQRPIASRTSGEAPAATSRMTFSTSSASCSQGGLSEGQYFGAALLHVFLLRPLVPGMSASSGRASKRVAPSRPPPRKSSRPYRSPSVEHVVSAQVRQDDPWTLRGKPMADCNSQGFRFHYLDLFLIQRALPARRSAAFRSLCQTSAGGARS